MSAIKKSKKRFDPVKVAEIGVAVFLLAVLAVFFIGFIPVSYPVLTRKAVALARQAGADSCTIGAVRVTLWKGVSLHEVVFSGTAGTGRRCSVRARSVSLRGNCLRMALDFAEVRPALQREIAGLKASFKTEPPGSLMRLTDMAAAGRIRGAAVASADIMIRDTRGILCSGNGISVEIAAREDRPSSFAGSFFANRLSLRENEWFSGVSGDFSGDAGELSVSRCRATMFDGDLRCDARFYPDRNALAGGTARVAGFNVDKWYKSADTANGRCRGTADGEMVFDSSALAFDSLKGKGTVTLRRFAASGFPFQQTLAGILLYPPVTHLAFKKVRCDFSLKPGGIFENSATGEGDSLDITADGTIRTDGRVNENIICTLSKKAVAGLPEFARMTLEDAPAGKRILRFRIFGRIANPKVEIESKIIMQKAVKNMFENVKQNIQLWLK